MGSRGVFSLQSSVFRRRRESPGRAGFVPPAPGVPIHPLSKTGPGPSQAAASAFGLLRMKPTQNEISIAIQKVQKAG